jgi:hypothetical protein
MIAGSRENEPYSSVWNRALKEMLLLAAALMILAPLPSVAQGIELPRLT